MSERILELALRIADDAARGLLLMESVPSANDEGWMDLAHVAPEVRAQVSDASEYLEARSLLVRKHGSEQQVRLTDPILPN